MAKTKSTAGSSSKPKGESPPQFAAWREFYANESARIKAENPGMKGKQVQKKCSVAYKRMKEEQEGEEQPSKVRKAVAQPSSDD
ncbi:hypothetical protein JCM10213_005084 [Rhodosporidiobolus nylandii]